MKKIVTLIVLLNSLNLLANVISPMEPTVITKATVRVSEYVRNNLIKHEKESLNTNKVLGKLKVLDISINDRMINYNLEYSTNSIECELNVTAYLKENELFTIFDNFTECNE